MFENPRRGRQAKNFTTNVPKILDLKSSSEQKFSENWRWVPWGLGTQNWASLFTRWIADRTWLQTQVGQSLSTLSWSWFRSFAQCYSFPFSSNGLARGHVAGIVKHLLFLRNITLFDPYLFVRKKGKTLCTKKGKKIASKKLIWRCDSGNIFLAVINQRIRRRAEVWVRN